MVSWVKSESKSVFKVSYSRHGLTEAISCLLCSQIPSIELLMGFAMEMLQESSKIAGRHRNPHYGEWAWRLSSDSSRSRIEQGLLADVCHVFNAAARV